MTERFDLEKAVKITGLNIHAESADEGRDFDVACRIILQALEEIQAYRAIGTVEECKTAYGRGYNQGTIDRTEEVTKAREHGYANAIDEVLESVKKTYHNFSGYDLEKMTKYGNESAEQQHESYSTLMLYEIAGEFDDLIDALEQMKATN